MDCPMRLIVLQPKNSYSFIWIKKRIQIIHLQDTFEQNFIPGKHRKESIIDFFEHWIYDVIWAAPWLIWAGLMKMTALKNIPRDQAEMIRLSGFWTLF